MSIIGARGVSRVVSMMLCMRGLLGLLGACARAARGNFGTAQVSHGAMSRHPCSRAVDWPSSSGIACSLAPVSTMCSGRADLLARTRASASLLRSRHWAIMPITSSMVSVSSWRRPSRYLTADMSSLQGIKQVRGSGALRKPIRKLLVFTCRPACPPVPPHLHVVRTGRGLVSPAQHWQRLFHPPVAASSIRSKGPGGPHANKSVPSSGNRLLHAYCMRQSLDSC